MNTSRISRAPLAIARFLRPLPLLIFNLALVTHISFGYFYSIRTSTGESMYPTLAVRGDWWICSKRHRRGKNIQVGDIVSFAHPLLRGFGGVKRVVGMPGDFVLAGTPGVGGGGEGVGMVQVSGVEGILVGGRVGWG
jgi:inner membrane protease subunit 1